MRAEPVRRPQLTTAGVGRADVYVFDAAKPRPTLGGTPLSVADALLRHAARARREPRRQTRSTRRRSTRAIRRHRQRSVVCDGGSTQPPCTCRAPSNPGGLPAPNTNFRAPRSPRSAHRTAEPIEQPLGGRARPQLDAGCVQPARPRRVLVDANNPAARRRRSRTSGPSSQHGGEPGLGEALRVEHRGAQRVPLRGPGGSPAIPVRGHLHEARHLIISGATVTPRH